MMQNRVEAPAWIRDVMLCKQHTNKLTEASAEQEIVEKFIWTESRETLVKILGNERRLDRRVLVVGKDIHTLVRLAKMLSGGSSSTKVVILNEKDENCAGFDRERHLQTLLDQKRELIADVTYLAQTLQYQVF